MFWHYRIRIRHSGNWSCDISTHVAEYCVVIEILHSIEQQTDVKEVIRTHVAEYCVVIDPTLYWAVKEVIRPLPSDPTWEEEWFLHLFMLTRWEMVKPVPTKAVLQPAKAAAMCMACLEYARPPPPIPPFLLGQKLSSKWITPTDNMWPKSDDTKRRHWWLKG